MAKVEVGFSQRGVLTTEDQKTYYAMVKYWEDQGSPGQDKPVVFSLRRLAKILKKRWGTDVITTLTQSLTRLYATPFFWTNSYYDIDTKKAVEEMEGFRILDALKIIKTKQDGHITKEAGYFKFNDYVLRNLLANHTKPLLLDVVLKFNSYFGPRQSVYQSASL
ncbi:MAG: hypothetical protein L0226_11695 [Acidobacteria bacterium]|nr:hypothetical protein [Acidobacteriota bacterium]